MTGYNFKFDIRLRNDKLLIKINDIKNCVLKYYEIQYNDLIY